MSIHHANRGIAKNNLLLYYNREFLNSFRGEATTNLLGSVGEMVTVNQSLRYDISTDGVEIGSSGWIYSVYPNSSVSAGSGLSWEPNLIDPFGKPGSFVLRQRPGGNSETQIARSVSIAMNSASTYVLSVYCKCSVPNVARIHVNVTQNGSSTWGYASGYHTGDGKWQRLTLTFTGGNGFTNLNYVRGQGLGSSTTADIQFKYFQFEEKSYATPFTTSSRSANTFAAGGGLIDLTGNGNNADLTNVGFGSSGFTFNGSSQFITLGTSRTSLNISADLTIESVIKLTSNFTLNPTIVGNGYWQEVYPYKLQFEYNSNNGNLGLFRYDGTSYRYASWNFGSQNTFFLNKYAHITATYNSISNSFAIYYNGVSQTITQSSPGLISVNNTTNFAIGVQIKTDGTRGDYFPGEINIVRVYNRALSSDEVLQNFNATRKTYGL